MTAIGAIKPLSDSIDRVRQSLHDQEALAKARVHPLTVLVALHAYSAGKGEKGKTTWSPVSAIVDILDETFYLAFKAIVPTGKRTLLALDCSASMTWPQSSINGMSGIKAREASAAMAMVTARTESDWAVVGFTSGRSSGFGISPIDISPKQRLDAVIRKIEAQSAGGTDCALPMLWAEKNNISVDTFVTYTDNESYAGAVHPVQALNAYRKKTGIPAKLVAVGMTATQYSIADPSDGGMMDVVGFDTAAPELIASFSRG